MENLRMSLDAFKANVDLVEETIALEAIQGGCCCCCCCDIDVN